MTVTLFFKKEKKIHFVASVLSEIVFGEGSNREEAEEDYFLKLNKYFVDVATESLSLFKEQGLKFTAKKYTFILQEKTKKDG